MKVMYDKVTLIGLGLIASSMGHAMKKIGLANEIVGFSQTKETREISLDIGFVDSVAETIEEAVAGADLIVLSVPVGAMAEVAKKIGPKLKLGATITDVGSVKKSVIDMVKPHIPAGVHFIPGHPLAGTEQSGPKSGFRIIQKPLVYFDPT
jgi:cyclohexadieny/prephenate dehydrogenase